MRALAASVVASVVVAGLPLFAPLSAAAEPMQTLPSGIWSGERFNHSSNGAVSKGRTSIQINNNWIIEHTETEGGYHLDELWGLRFKANGKVDLLSADKKIVGAGTCSESSCIVLQKERDTRTETRIFFGANDLSIYECGEVGKVSFCRHSFTTKPEASRAENGTANKP